MTRCRSIVTLLTVAALAHPGAAASKAAKPLRAGVARVEITPPLGLPMYGYAGRKSGATGVLDPLMARVLVLEAGGTRLALVVLDLGEPPAAQWIQRLRERVAATSGLTHVLVSATHTHSGPDIRDVFPPANGPDWESAMLDKVAGAIDQSHRQAVDATIGTGYGNVLIGHNRLRLERDGTIEWFERNTTMVPTSPVDPTVSVIRVDALDGTPFAARGDQSRLRPSSAGTKKACTRPSPPCS